MLRNKKGDASAIILILVILFFLAVSFLVVNYVGIELTDVMNNTVLNTTAASPNVVQGMQTITTKTIDNGFMIFFSFLIIGIILSSFLIRIHPAWLFLYIIFLAAAIFMAVFLGNSYQVLAEKEVFGVAMTNMPRTLWVMMNIVKIILAVGALSMVIIFSKVIRPGGFTERI